MVRLLHLGEHCLGLLQLLVPSGTVSFHRARALSLQFTFPHCSWLLNHSCFSFGKEGHTISSSWIRVSNLIWCSVLWASHCPFLALLTLCWSTPLPRVSSGHLSSCSCISASRSPITSHVSMPPFFCFGIWKKGSAGLWQKLGKEKHQPKWLMTWIGLKKVSIFVWAWLQQHPQQHELLGKGINFPLKRVHRGLLPLKWPLCFWILHLSGQLHKYFHVSKLCSMDFAHMWCCGSIAHWQCFLQCQGDLRGHHPGQQLAHSRVPPSAGSKGDPNTALASPVPRTHWGHGKSSYLCRALPRDHCLLSCHQWFGIPW